MLLYTVFTTDLDGPVDARLRAPLGTVAASMDRDTMEQAIVRARLRIEVRDTIGTEWREHDEERKQPIPRDLLRLARLRRQREQVVARFGHAQYDIHEASLHWLVHIMLGKPQPMMYVLGHDTAAGR